MSLSHKVKYTKFAEKQIDRLPDYIVKALRVWAQTIELSGIQSMRKLPGYHDEPLKGDRKGQRSSKLNRAYRVIYVEAEDGSIMLIVN